MTLSLPAWLNILKDDLVTFTPDSPAFVALGETMLRDTPADNERLERTRQVWLSLGGSELTVAVMLRRLGIPSSYVTRLPDNPYGWMVRNVAREQGLDTSHFVWADKTELIGRYLYELGRTPRPGAAWYQRKYSAASRLMPGMVDWSKALKMARLLHTSGITLGLTAHSGYERNYLLETLQEAIKAKPATCQVGFDFNYRSTLWSIDECRQVLTPLIEEHIDILVTTIEDMVNFYEISPRDLTPGFVEGGGIGRLEDDQVEAFLQRVIARFNLQIAAITIRWADSHEQHRWESAVMHREGYFYRSPAIRPVVLWDRLGGGDAWVGGFYYGLLTESNKQRALEKGILVGDAATRLKQTLMYDLPAVTPHEIQALLQADGSGGGMRVNR